jgi:polysaccharide export outer membrane protein
MSIAAEGTTTVMARAPLRLLLPVLLATLSACSMLRREPVQATKTFSAVPEEKLGVDDTFEVRVLGEADFSGIYRIGADGTIDYPYAGRIKLLGMRIGEVQELLTARLRDGVLKNPQVTVMIKEWNSRKIIVLGQVQKPGPVVYFPNMTIVDAIAAAGSFTAIAAKNSVTLRREANGRAERRSYPVADITEGRSPNVTLLPGDVVVVEERLF